MPVHTKNVENTITRKSATVPRFSRNTAAICAAIVPQVTRLAHRQSPPDPYSSKSTSSPVGSRAAAIRSSGGAAFS